MQRREEEDEEEEGRRESRVVMRVEMGVEGGRARERVGGREEPLKEVMRMLIFEGGEAILRWCWVCDWVLMRQLVMVDRSGVAL